MLKKTKLIIFISFIIIITTIMIFNKTIIPTNNTFIIQNYINVPNYVWLYWENKMNTQTPNHIQLCRKSIIKN